MKRIYLFIILLAYFGMQAQDLTGVVRFTQNPTLATIDTTATKPIGRRASDGRLVRYNWVQLKNYFATALPDAQSLQDVIEVNPIATYPDEIRITSGSGTVFTELSLAPEVTAITHSSAANFSQVALSNHFVGLSAGDNQLSINPDTASINSALGVGAPVNPGDAVRLSDLEAATTGTFVPYTGADSDVDLNGNSLYGVGEIDGSSIYANGFLGVRSIFISASATFKADNLTSSRILQAPNASGTIALLSDVTAGIPLSGTTTGNPVTGDIEINNDKGLVNINDTEGTFTKVSTIDGELQLYSANDTFNSYLGIGATSIRVNSSDPDSIGLTAQEDYSSNNDGTDRKIYTQTGWVQDYVAAEIAGVGGGGTVTSVTGVSGETTVASGTTTPVVGIDSAYTAARDAYADGKLAKANNLSDLPSASTARTNLGLTALATTTPGTNVATFLTTPTSANLAAALTDETGTGAAVFGTSPTFSTSITTPVVAPAATSGSAVGTSSQPYENGYFTRLTTNTTALTVGTTASAGLSLITNNTGRWEITSGGMLRPVTNTTYTFGDATHRPTNIFSVAGDYSGTITAAALQLSALNTAPASSTAAGTTGEIRVTSGFIYVCVATNTWVRTPLITF